MPLSPELIAAVQRVAPALEQSQLDILRVTDSEGLSTELEKIIRILFGYLSPERRLQLILAVFENNNFPINGAAAESSEQMGSHVTYKIFEETVASVAQMDARFSGSKSNATKLLQQLRRFDSDTHGRFFVKIRGEEYLSYRFYTAVLDSKNPRDFKRSMELSGSSTQFGSQYFNLLQTVIQQLDTVTK